MLSTSTITMRCHTCGGTIDVPLQLDSTAERDQLRVRITMDPCDDLLLGVFAQAHVGPFGQA